MRSVPCESLSPELKANVLKASASRLVQKNITLAMFDCMFRADTSVSDVWEYIEDSEEEDYSDEVCNALFGTQGEDEHISSDAVGSDPKAIQLLIDNVKQIVTDSLDSYWREGETGG